MVPTAMDSIRRQRTTRDGCERYGNGFLESGDAPESLVKKEVVRAKSDKGILVLSHGHEEVAERRDIDTGR